MRINQVASGFSVAEDGTAPHRLFDDPRKNPRIEALLEVIAARPEKMLIWARFRDDINQIMEVLPEGSAVRYDGSTSDKDRTIAIDRLRNDPDTRFFVSNPRAGGTGLNLQGTANLAVYYSHIDGPINRWQSEDRIHRLGTVGIVDYIDLVAEGSLDKRILKTYATGVALSEMALPEIRDLLLEENA